MTAPLPLPAAFNPATDMIARREGDRTFHAPRLAFELAHELLANGHADDVTQAEKTLAAALSCQETRLHDPHRGNFLWEAEEETVEDLNAVQFCLFQLLPTVMRYGGLLSAALQERCRAAVRLGLEEIARIDVHPRYTNIVLKDITNTLLGGQYLDDEVFKRRGRDKLARWMAFTDRSGCPYEYNSPGYAAVALTVLHRLIELIDDEAVRVRAEVMRARIGLSAALHIHTATGRWAGPFSRAYGGVVFCDVPPEITTIRAWLAAGVLPEWVEAALDERPATMDLVETADAANDVVLATHHSPSFVLGVATQELSSQANRFIAGQSNGFIVHHTTDNEATGVIYCRYVLDERWLGDFRPTPARTNRGLLFDEGRFRGVQQGRRALCLYAPRTLGAWETCHSAKAVIAWHRREHVAEVWVNGERVDAYPAPLPPSSTVVVRSGGILTAIRPLAHTDLGRDAPVHLIERDGHLCLEIYNYKGPAKTFWEMAHPGSFYQGQPQCGFYAEVAEASEWPDAAAFGQAVAAGALEENAAPPVTYEDGVERPWRVAYGRDGQTLGIEVDLMDWRLKRRWTQDGDLGTPMLDSPLAKQTRTGAVRIGDAVLECAEQPAWLLAAPTAKTYVAAYHGPASGPLKLTCPDGSVEIAALACGIVVWRDGKVFVDAAGMAGEPAVVGGRLVGTE